VEWPEAGNVGGPSMGELAADCSRSNGEVHAGAGGDSGGAHGGQHGRSGDGGVRVHRGDGAAGGATVAVGLAAASGRGRDGAMQLCCGGRRQDACGEGRSTAARSPGRGEGVVLGRCSKAVALGGRLGGRRAWTRLHGRRSRLPGAGPWHGQRNARHRRRSRGARRRLEREAGGAGFLARVPGAGGGMHRSRGARLGERGGRPAAGGGPAAGEGGRRLGGRRWEREADGWGQGPAAGKKT
jgi:hypothetical protein